MNDWYESFLRAKKALQQRSDMSSSSDPQNKQITPPEHLRPKSIQDIRKQNFKNFKSTKTNTAVPVILGRYPIFEPVKTGRRVFHKEWTPLYPFHWIKDDQHIELWKRFKTLNQHDCTVYLVLRQHADKDFVTAMTRYEILKAMRLKPAGANYKYIYDVIDRLFGTQFKIQYANEYIFEDSLVQRIWKKRSQHAYIVELSKALDAFLQVGHWSKINIQQRLELGQNQLAQSFHLYLSVNQCPTGGRWFSWRRDIWPVWGRNYKYRGYFIWEFKKHAIKPLMDIGFIQSAQENRTKTAVCLTW